MLAILFIHTILANLCFAGCRCLFYPSVWVRDKNHTSSVCDPSNPFLKSIFENEFWSYYGSVQEMISSNDSSSVKKILVGLTRNVFWFFAESHVTIALFWWPAIQGNIQKIVFIGNGILTCLFKLVLHLSWGFLLCVTRFRLVSKNCHLKKHQRTSYSDEDRSQGILVSATWTKRDRKLPTSIRLGSTWYAFTSSGTISELC